MEALVIVPHFQFDRSHHYSSLLEKASRHASVSPTYTHLRSGNENSAVSSAPKEKGPGYRDQIGSWQIWATRLKDGGIQSVPKHRKIATASSYGMENNIRVRTFSVAYF